MEDGSEETEEKAKKDEKEDPKEKDKKKKTKKAKIKSESPEPLGIDDDPKDTQVTHCEWYKKSEVSVLENISTLKWKI